MILYHATFQAYLESIMRYGLGTHKIKNWSGSIPGTVCLTSDMDVAQSFCEASEATPEEIFESGIVILAINCSGLVLTPDTNILQDDLVPNSTTFWEYHGIIHPNRIKWQEKTGL